MQAASGLAASVFAVPVAPPLASDGGGQKNKSRARPASGNQFGHHGVGNNPFLHRCSNRFSRRGYRQCRPHAYQPTTIFSRRSRGRLFPGVFRSASGSLACAQGQSRPSPGLCPRLYLSYFPLLRPARFPLSSRISLRQGHAGYMPPPLVPPGLPSITVSTAQILLHRRLNYQSPPRDSLDSHGSPRPPAKGPRVLPTRPPPPPLGLPLPRLSLVRRFLACKAWTVAILPPFHIYHQPQRSSNCASPSSATRTLAGRAINSPNQPVVLTQNISSEALRSSPMISSIIFHPPNVPLCRISNI